MCLRVLRRQAAAIVLGPAMLLCGHSTSSSAKVTLEAKATKHAPATSNKPMKLRSQITVALEHIEMTSSSRQ